MKKNFIFFLFVLVIFNLKVTSQELITLSKPSSEILKSFIIRKDLKGDTIVFLLISPNAAPRLESLFNDFYSMLKNQGFKGDIIGIVNHPKRKYAENLIMQNHFNFPCFYDEGDSIFADLGFFRRIPPYALLVNRNGFILNWMLLYGVMLDNNLVAKFLATTREIKEKPDVPEDNWGFSAKEFKYPILKSTSEITLKYYENLGLLREGNLNITGDLMAVTDFDNYELLIFSTITGKIQNHIKLTNAEKMTFSTDFPEKDWDYYEKENFIRTLCFSPVFVNDTMIAFISSFPVLSYKIENGDSVLVYNVVNPIVLYDIRNGRVTKFINTNVIDTIFNFVFSFSLRLYYNPNRNIFALPCRKGYPVIGFQPPKDTSYAFNPTTPSFFDFAPLFFTFDAKLGKYIGHIGELNRLNMNIGSGYYMANQIIGFDTENFFTHQRMEDFVLINNKDTLKIKSYYNKQVLENIRKASYNILLSPKELEKISNSLEAVVTNIFKSQNSFFVIWRLKEKGKELFRSTLFILQKYNFSEKKLENEWLIPPSIGLDFKPAFFIFNSTNKRLIGFYENNSEEKLIFYTLE